MAILKGAAVLAVLLLAGLSCLFVLDLIPRSTLDDLTVKTLYVCGILAAAGLAVSLLVRKPGA